MLRSVSNSVTLIVNRFLIFAHLPFDPFVHNTRKYGLVF